MSSKVFRKFYWKLPAYFRVIFLGNTPVCDTLLTDRIFPEEFIKITERFSANPVARMQMFNGKYNNII
jgi:hypothetical protein